MGSVAELPLILSCADESAISERDPETELIYRSWAVDSYESCSGGGKSQFVS